MQFCRIHLVLVSMLAWSGMLPEPLSAKTPVASTASTPDDRDLALNAVIKPKQSKVRQSGEGGDGPVMSKGLKVWVTRGGSYCIKEIAVDGKLRCQSEAAWAKEGVTFNRVMAKLP